MLRTLTGEQLRGGEGFAPPSPLDALGRAYVSVCVGVKRLLTRCLCYQGSRPRQFFRRKAAVSAAKPKHKTLSNHESTSGYALALVVRLSGAWVLVILDLAVLTQLDLVVLAALAVLEGNAAMTLMRLLHLMFLHLLHLTLASSLHLVSQ